MDVVRSTNAENHSADTNEIDNGKICLTPDCVHSILKKIDFKVDPCEDFYGFACGNFIKENRVPDEKTSKGTTEEIQSEVRRQLKLLMTEGKDAKTLYIGQAAI